MVCSGFKNMTYQKELNPQVYFNFFSTDVMKFVNAVSDNFKKILLLNAMH